MLTWLLAIGMAPQPAGETSTELEATNAHTNERKSSHAERQLSDLEKETLAAYEGHDADIPSNEGYVLDERGELKRIQSIAALHRKASRSSHEQTNGNAAKDAEKNAGEVVADEDANVVWWDGPDDPANPLNFSKWLKVGNIMIVSALCFVTPLASSMFAPGVPDLMR
jgi:hypothetical protein